MGYVLGHDRGGSDRTRRDHTDNCPRVAAWSCLLDSAASSLVGVVMISGRGRTLTIIPLQRLQDYVHTSSAPSQIQGLLDDFLAGALSEDA
jgi:hypothetical protein